MSKPVSLIVIRRAIDIIKDADHWTMGAEARREDGTVTDVWERDAVSFCVMGAVRRAAYDLTPTRKQGRALGKSVLIKLESWQRQSDGAGIVDMNDNHLRDGVDWPKGRDILRPRTRWLRESTARKRNHPLIILMLRRYAESIEQ